MIGTIERITKHSGILVVFDNGIYRWWLPWYVLKKAKPAPMPQEEPKLFGTLFGKPVYEVEMDVEVEFGYDIEQMLIDFGMITKKKESGKDDNK